MPCSVCKKHDLGILLHFELKLSVDGQGMNPLSILETDIKTHIFCLPFFKYESLLLFSVIRAIAWTKQDIKILS